MTSDRRERPWRKLRVIVEVTVPPTNRSTEKDLQYAVEQVLPRTVMLPRPAHANAYKAHIRTKTFGRFLPAALVKRRRGEKI